MLERWPIGITPDEIGATNLLLGAAPHAEVSTALWRACSRSTTCAIGRLLRHPRSRWISARHRRLRFIATPHVPHNWEAGLWFDEGTSTLLAGDLLAQAGNPAALTQSDCIAAALELAF